MLTGTPPEIPNDFTLDTFVVVKKDCDSYVVSDRCQEHLIGYFVDFEPYEHLYIVGKQYMSRSVTEVLESLFGKFDAYKTIQNMKSSSFWPRPEYSTIGASGVLYPFSDEQIILKWAEDRNRGTWMHFNIERFLNGLQYSSDVQIEMDYFIKFYEKEILGRGLIPYITEWRIASPVLKLGGSVDFVGSFDDGTFGIVDWKRIKNWDSLHVNYGKRCLGLLSDLDASNFNKYSLQLNMYRFILEHEYGIKVSWMAVASFHPNQCGYEFAVVEIMDEAVQKITCGLLTHNLI